MCTDWTLRGCVMKQEALGRVQNPNPTGPYQTLVVGVCRFELLVYMSLLAIPSLYVNQTARVPGEIFLFRSLRSISGKVSRPLRIWFGSG
jgi:hypothetical protein